MEEESQGNPSFDQSSNYQIDPIQEWEMKARAWFSLFPEGKTVTMGEFDAWIDSNQASLPDNLKSIPRTELYQRFNSICMGSPNQQEKEASMVEFSHRFQRTDQWLPVYSWLESLETDEVVKSKDVSDWLSENPTVKDQLGLRHSRYHLMHYIKKCHMKILKRKEKRKGFQQSNDASPVKAPTIGVTRPAPIPSNVPGNPLEDSEAYLAKRTEALHKYKILVELEKQLSTIFPEHKNVNNSKES